MSRHVVIGTAGHVDHGKTALVKALTGIDADRWEEEKRRGITIDLGFAKLELGEGQTASVVDVPGHEDFVRNMVAGATGIDVVLLVIAADEGVMPQTHEHLAIIEFLGVQSGVVAITKCDLVEEEWLELVEEDVRDKLKGSAITWAEKLCRVSSVSGEGVEDLRKTLTESANSAAVRSEEDLFRLPVDRVFSIAGAGTVVTGTTWSGTINVGDEVRLLPQDARGRVRGIEVHDESCNAALPGRRTALALVGLNRSDVERGNTVVSENSWRATSAVDVLVTLLPDSRPLTQRSRVRFHLGTAEVMARLTPTASEVPPGAKDAAVRLRLEAPIVCRWGDHGVLRSYSPITTIGGCVVVDPFPAPRPRRPANLEARSVQDIAARLTAFVDAADRRGLRIAELPVRMKIPPTQVAGLIESNGGILRAGERLFSPTVVREAREKTLRALEEYHQAHPLEPGMPRDLARQVIQDAALADEVQALLENEKVVALEARIIRLTDFRAQLSNDQNAVAKAVREKLVEAGFEGRTAAELADLTGGQSDQDLLAFFCREGTTVRVGKDRYYDKDELAKLIAVVLQETERLGQVKPADLREKTGLSRKYLIPLLEWMDGQSLTMRVGDARGLGPAASNC